MLPLWRVTRNRFGERLHARLDDAGVTVSRLYEYRAPLPAGDDASPPADVTIRRVEPSSLPERAPIDELIAEESVFAAVAGGTVAGYLFLSVDAEVPVPELRTTLSVDGGYVRRLFVDPDHRRRGIAGALVGAATTAAAERGADAATALVAVDNRPSQWTFEGRGFERVARRAYDRLWGFDRRRRRPLAGD
jgi:ribosomal protein S18 acetylase RimI-like enzyme